MLQDDYRSMEDTRQRFNEFMRALTTCHIARKRTSEYTYLDSPYKSNYRDEIAQLMMAETYGYKFNGINLKTNVMTLLSPTDSKKKNHTSFYDVILRHKTDCFTAVIIKPFKSQEGSIIYIKGNCENIYKTLDFSRKRFINPTKEQ